MALPPGPIGLKFWQPRVENTEANWFRLYDNTSLPSSTSSWGNDTLRQAIPVAGYSADAPATGTKLRVTVQSGTTLGGGWDKLYIGHAAASGDTYDFDGTQVQVFFSGSPSGDIAPGRATLTSDAVIYAFDKTKPLVISMHNSGGTNSKDYGSIFSGMPTGFDVNKSAGSVDQAATTDVSGGTTTNNRLSAFPKVEVYFEAVTDSGPVTLPAGGGSYTLTGSPVGLGPGYWITGFDAAFTTASAGGTTLAADAGSYALTGTAAGLVYPTTLTAAAGSYTLTGSAIGLGLGYWITGSDVTFTTAAGGGTTLTAAAGSYTLTGAGAALNLGAVASSGNYTLTGTAAAYRITLAAAAGSYAITGSPATFLAPFRLPAAGGAYTLTGFDAGLNIISGVVLFCGSGSYTLTGSDAALPPLVTEPVPPTDNYTGGASRGRMIRKFRKRREDEEEPIPVIGSTPVAAPPPPPTIPPQPGLMASMPRVRAELRKRADPDEDEDEIALLLELIS